MYISIQHTLKNKTPEFDVFCPMKYMFLQMRTAHDLPHKTQQFGLKKGHRDVRLIQGPLMHKLFYGCNSSCIFMQP